MNINELQGKGLVGAPHLAKVTIGAFRLFVAAQSLPKIGLSGAETIQSFRYSTVL